MCGRVGGGRDMTFAGYRRNLYVGLGESRRGWWWGGRLGADRRGRGPDCALQRLADRGLRGAVQESATESRDDLVREAVRTRLRDVRLDVRGQVHPPDRRVLRSAVPRTRCGRPKLGPRSPGRERSVTSRRAG